MRWRKCEFHLTFSAVLLAAGLAHADEAPGLIARPPAEGRSVATDRGFMVPYTERIPGTDVTFEMIPVPGGGFLLGSPEIEPDRNADEGPQVRVTVAPCWIGKCEVTWAEYQAFMAMYEAFKSLNSLRDDQGKLAPLDSTREYLKHESFDVDGVTAPTPLYDSSFTYAAGEEPDQPAVTMTQFAAKQYTKWLSGITGREYRLPTEAEWEYAARAGTSTAYSFGDDASDLGDYAWFEDNADYLTHTVGKKKPNAWGLHDMHGNVAEWVLDEYAADHYAKLGDKGVFAGDAIAWPTKLYPRVIRGGCWFDAARLCRSAARHKSDDPEWNIADPNLPKSPWWFTEDPATGVGFRIVRPLTLMDDAMKSRVWEADLERIREDVAARLDEGRGAQSAADPRLPAAVEELRAAGLIEQ
jgi:formylglycine-generating enzyme required for sulfatase activity